MANYNKKISDTCVRLGEVRFSYAHVFEPRQSDNGGEPKYSVLAQLAEEAAELAQAALKLRRVVDGRNPTPVTEQEARQNLMEEYTDVVHCALELGVIENLHLIVEKRARWKARLGLEGEKDGA